MARGPGVVLRAKLAALHARGAGCPCCTPRPLIPGRTPPVDANDDGT